jgi:hypothetical protein
MARAAAAKTTEEDGRDRHQRLLPALVGKTAGKTRGGFCCALAMLLLIFAAAKTRHRGTAARKGAAAIFWLEHGARMPRWRA